MRYYSPARRVRDVSFNKSNLWHYSCKISQKNRYPAFVKLIDCQLQATYLSTHRTVPFWVAKTLRISGSMAKVDDWEKPTTLMETFHARGTQSQKNNDILSNVKLFLKQIFFSKSLDLSLKWIMFYNTVNMRRASLIHPTNRLTTSHQTWQGRRESNPH